MGDRKAEPTKALFIRVPESMDRELQRCAADEDRDKTSMIRVFIRDGLDKHKKKKARHL